MQSLSQKRCPNCGETKESTQFRKDKSTKDGLATWCTACMSASQHVWYLANKDRARENLRRQRRDNPEKARELVRNWRLANPQKTRELAKKQRDKERDTSPDKQRERMHKWQVNNPDKVRENNRNRRAWRMGNGGRFTKLEWDTLREAHGYTCLSCGRKEPEIKLTPDHVIPLSKGGRNSISNIQPLCVSCNSRKGTKHIDYR